ncbi:hypothetical protein ACFORL_08245 [Legionella dresdenensis]|uniref:Uncharacterized protein n=1 Tax=Legionella dresdenensis TaxID=450200 RepID=A0ABV8CFS8_9GAMM
MPGSRKSQWNEIIGPVTYKVQEWENVFDKVDPDKCTWESIFVMSKFGYQSDVFFAQLDGVLHERSRKFRSNAPKPYLILFQPKDYQAYERQLTKRWFESCLSVQAGDFPDAFFNEVKRGNVYFHVMKVGEQPSKSILTMSTYRANKIDPGLARFRANQAQSFNINSTNPHEIKENSDKYWLGKAAFFSCTPSMTLGSISLPDNPVMRVPCYAAIAALFLLTLPFCALLTLITIPVALFHDFFVFANNAICTGQERAATA